MAIVTEASVEKPRRTHGIAVPRPLRWRLSPVARRELILLPLLILCYGFFRQEPFWNENTRYDLVLVLVDDGTTRIDRYHENTGDKSFYNGHYYSDKAPGTSFLVVPVYALMRALSGGTAAGDLDQRPVLEALTFAAAVLPTALLALLLLRFLRSLVDEGWALFITLAYAFGTIAFPFATMFFGHAAATFFLFAAFYSLWRTRHKRSTFLPSLAGFLAGWAVLVDFTTVLGLAALLGYAFLGDRRAPFLMAAGGLLPALLLLGYNWVSFGGPFNLGYSNLADEGFAAGMSQGVFGVTAPRLSTLSEILFDSRGLLQLSPWLALAPLGLWAVRRAAITHEVALCGVITLAFLVFNAGYYLPFGGATPGPRFLMPALPFAAALVALAPRPFRPLISLQVAFSVGLLLLATATMPNAPEWFANPISDLWLPRLLAGDLAENNAWLRWGVPGTQPLVLIGLAATVASVGFYATTRPGSAMRWLSGTSVGFLVALTVALGTPFNLAATPAPATAGPTNTVDIALAHVGVTRLRIEGEQLGIAPWTQFQNRGRPLEDTTVVFSIYDSSGERIWAGWHSDVDWREHERKRLGVEWDVAGVAPGDYRVDIAVTSADEQVMYATWKNTARVRLGP